MKPVAEIKQNVIEGYNDEVVWLSSMPIVGTKLYTADQLKAAKVEVLRDAALEIDGIDDPAWELRRMADELEKGTS